MSIMVYNVNFIGTSDFYTSQIKNKGSFSTVLSPSVTNMNGGQDNGMFDYIFNIWYLRDQVLVQ